jgi:hypothetical protein
MSTYNSILQSLIFILVSSLANVFFLTWIFWRTNPRVYPCGSTVMREHSRIHYCHAVGELHDYGVLDKELGTRESLRM